MTFEGETMSDKISDRDLGDLSRKKAHISELENLASIAAKELIKLRSSFSSLVAFKVFELSQENEKLRERAERAETCIKAIANNGIRFHTVVSGDTLFGLSQKYYNDPYLFFKIVEANRGIIVNPDLIQIGWNLIIP